MPDTTLASAEARLLQTLRALGSPKRAEWEKAYQKSRWEHWGVPLPGMDAATKQTLGDLSQNQALALCRRLWREPVWDLKIVAARILGQKSIEPDAAAWGFVTERLIDLDGWAVADNLAGVASRCLIEDPARLDAVETWIESPHLWTRRAALVFTLPWAKEERDPERMLGWAARLAEDREWFIQKAIGWWLRELSKRDPKRVRGFLTDHGGKLSGVAKREATKYLKGEAKGAKGGRRLMDLFRVIARNRSGEPATKARRRGLYPAPSSRRAKRRGDPELRKQSSNLMDCLVASLLAMTEPGKTHDRF